MNYKDPQSNLHSIDSDDFEDLLPAGSVQITDAEAEALRSKPAPPTPLEQIRALEQKHDDDQRKITRISILELALDKACANPAMAGKTRAQVHELYSAASRGYRELFALEVECARLRKLIV